MKINTRRRRVLWAMMLALVLALGMAGCSDSSEKSEDSAATEQSEGSSTARQAEGGSPWVNSNEGGNIPIEQPEVRDDFYLHCNYDYLAGHAVTGGGTMRDSMSEVQESVTKIIKDASQTDHAVEQMRIFYNQTANLEARAQTGLSEVQPYLDRIQAVGSIEELNTLLSSSDYPFIPFVEARLGVVDMNTINVVALYPKFVFSNGAMGGAESYQDTDDPSEELFHQTIAIKDTLCAKCGIAALGTPEEDVENRSAELKSFEATYGKYADYNSKWNNMPYGEYGKAVKSYTLEELLQLCPSVPMKNLLAKSGKDGSPLYAVVSPEWVGALNNVWNNDNLENLKDLVALSLLSECSCILDPALYTQYYTTIGIDASDADACAYYACNTIDTFGNVIGQTYVDDVLGAQVKERLTNITNEIIDTYRGLFQETAWMSDESKANAQEKLDHMRLCILEPDGGYFDYSGLELTPADQGGTLLGNLLAVKQYNYRCENALIGQPARAVGVWDVAPCTEVNCFYDPQNNSINILPGFTTSGVYTNEMTDQELYAGIGAVIGHEISHGFDFGGSQYDAYGRGQSIFASQDINEFIGRTQKLADYYNTIEISKGVYADGENQKVEAAADLCGLQATLLCAKKAEGFDGKEFFTNQAKLWCQIYPAGTTLALSFDTHPLNYLRANVNAQMFEDLYDTYDVHEGDGMYLAPENRIVMWGPDAN